MPTTGEFGTRGGLGDLEHHTKVAMRFGVSAAQSRESRYSPVDAPPTASWIRLSDAVNPFEAGALALYVVGGKVFDDFEREPWEIGGGASFYPVSNRGWRINLHVLKVEKTPASSTFGFYTAGQTGMTYSLGTDILL